MFLFVGRMLHISASPTRVPILNSDEEPGRVFFVFSPRLHKFCISAIMNEESRVVITGISFHGVPQTCKIRLACADWEGGGY